MHRDLVGQRQRLALVVGDQHRGRAGRPQRAGRRRGPCPRADRRRATRTARRAARRGPGRQRAGERDPLLLAAGQLVRVAGTRGSPGSSTRSSSSSTSGTRARCARGRPKAMLARDVEVREQRALLRDVADAGAAAAACRRPSPTTRPLAEATRCRRRGRRSPAMMRSSVVLPQPDGPSTAVMAALRRRRGRAPSSTSWSHRSASSRPATVKSGHAGTEPVSVCRLRRKVAGSEISDHQQRVRRGGAVRRPPRSSTRMRSPASSVPIGASSSVAVSSVTTARKTSAAPAPRPGAISGSVTRRAVSSGLDPERVRDVVEHGGACSRRRARSPRRGAGT